MIASGALCRVRFLLVEWHLNSLPAQERLSALALRHSIKQILRACEGPADRKPVLMLNDEEAPNNEGEPVPGLAELLAKHPAMLPSRTAAASHNETSHGLATGAAMQQRRPYAEAHARLASVVPASAQEPSAQTVQRRRLSSRLPGITISNHRREISV